METKYQVKCRLKAGDEVIVIAGKNKNQTGKIDQVDKKKRRVYIGGVNIAKKHMRPTSSEQYGGIIDKVMPLAISNVMLLDPKKKKPTRIGYKVEGDRKVRYAKLSGAILEN